MQTIFIAESSDDLCRQLTSALCREFRVRSCTSGENLLEQLRSDPPDALILSLALPGGEGFYLLDQLGELRPKVILCTTDSTPAYIYQSAKDLGVGFLIQKPCRVQAIVYHITDMLRRSAQPGGQDPQEKAAVHLKKLGVAYREGYDMLRIGIPLFAQDPRQRMVKDLYPAIAAVYREIGAGSVESSIRTGIEKAWEHRDPTVWAEYFPDAKKAPSNKVFISRLAQML